MSECIKSKGAVDGSNRSSLDGGFALNLPLMQVMQSSFCKHLIPNLFKTILNWTTLRCPNRRRQSIALKTIASFETAQICSIEMRGLKR